MTERPWGNYEVLIDSPKFRSKRLTIQPGRRTSLQSHAYRSEYWFFLTGRAKVLIDGIEMFKGPGEKQIISAGTIHRLENIGREPLEVAEIWEGDYLSEDDIVRYEDDHARVKIVAVSGGFDPLHDGHVIMFEEAAKLGLVHVIVNSDEWLIRKKGYVFMPCEMRKHIVKSCRFVYAVLDCIDKDHTVCETLAMLKPNIFLNGGDRSCTEEIPETAVCRKYGIEMRFIAGNKSHSSVLLKEAAEKVKA